VVIPIHDFDQVIYRIRPIDFDQQCYEGNLKIYRPQYFKENKIMVDLVNNRLKPNSVDQYRKEVKSLISKRISNSSKRFRDLMKIMKKDTISKPENVAQLRKGFAKFYKDQSYEDCKTMGEILYKAIANSLEQIK